MRLTGRSAAVLVAGAGAALLLLAAGRSWVHGSVPGLTGTTRVSVSGQAAQPVVVALGLVAAAAAVALALAGARARVALGVCLLLVAAGALAVAAGVLTDPAAAVRSGWSGAPGSPTTGAAVREVRLSGWPWAAVAAGLALAGAAGLTLTVGRRWAPAGSRFDAGTGPAGERGAPSEVWDALSRGEDPTASG